jgi:hypothetical protein
MRAVGILLLLAAGTAVCALDVSLADFQPRADGVSDDTTAFQNCFAAVAEAGGGTVTIPPGDYALTGAKPIPLCSRLTVLAHGARFHLPEKLGDKARVVLFSGTDVQGLRWRGGRFLGRCFDWQRAENTWEPNANTRAILVTTSPGGTTAGLDFREITSDGLAGAVVTVLGALKDGERDVHTFARNVTVADCTLERSGKFMWDYGLLWQITVWPEDYDERERAMAAKHFRNDLISAVRFADSDNAVQLDPAAKPPAVSRNGGPAQAVCFFGDALPANVVRGKQYFVVASEPGCIRIAERPGGEPLRFSGTGGAQARMVRDLFSAFHLLYAPTGSGPGKGAVDLVGCRNVQVHGCRLSALGDTMHIQRCEGIVFGGNHITGSRMGAFFLAEYCRNAVITGNIVEGTNGSRVMSIEKSCTDVTVIGNTFRGGGRGSWINQPVNLVMQGNLFVNNTTKGEADPRRGRRTYLTGDYERWPELYFTTYESGATYGPVILTDNLVTTGPEARAAVRFESGGRLIRVEGNIVRGATGAVLVEGDAQVVFGDNPGTTREDVPAKP